MSERIGLFGGSFDPIHLGHLISARSLAERLGFKRVVLIPSARPPHKRGISMTAPEDRLAMAKLAVEDEELFEVSDLELARPGPSFTLDTVNEFRRRLGEDAELYWLIGADSLPEVPTWQRVGELVQRVTIVTATRPGWRPPEMTTLAIAVGEAAARRLLEHCIETPAIDISATGIRRRSAAGRSIRFLVPEGVWSYIHRHGLYTPSVNGAVQ